jgi:glycosyltransferase involved in cell wall biosynthesis
MPREEIEAAEKVMIANADFVFVTSPVLKEKYNHWFPQKLISYFPNVADRAHFQKALSQATVIPQDVQQIRKPLVGFVGAISHYKFDLSLVAGLAKARPEINFVLIGKVGEGDPETDASILELPNIHLIGPKPYDELPNYLKAFDCVIIPSPINAYTKSMFPMKFFEYLAARKVIVSTPLPSLKEFGRAYLEASSVEEFSRALDTALTGKGVDWDYIEEISQSHTWENRTRSMIGVVESQ